MTNYLMDYGAPVEGFYWKCISEMMVYYDVLLHLSRTQVECDGDLSTRI